MGDRGLVKSLESGNEAKVGRSDRAPYRRARILKRLASATDFAVTVIVAAAGYGKTTAVVEFLEECSDYVLIRTPQAASLQKFLNEFSRACARRFPLMGTPPDEFDGSPEKIPDTVDLYASWALTHLIDAKCLIAIDDLHLGDADPAIGMFVTRVIDGTLSSVKWILSSRTRGKLPLSRWRAYGDADEPIFADELRITFEEAEHLANAWKSPATPEQLQHWLRQTNGFPVPLSYAIRLSARRGSVEGIIDGTRSLTFEFLADHLWSTLDKQDQELLEIAAFLPETHIHHFETAGVPFASARLAALSADIAFLGLKTDGSFGMHDLFRDFVIQRLNIAGLATLSRRQLAAIRILAQANKFEDALRILIGRGDHFRLKTLIEEIGERVTDHTLIREIIDAFEGSDTSKFGLKLLSMHTDYWAWHGDARKSKNFSLQILLDPSAKSNDLFLALRSFYRSIDIQSEVEQREWLRSASDHFNSLSSTDQIQIDAFRASILARYADSRNEAQQIIEKNVTSYQLLDPSDRLSAEIATANACYWLDDTRSTLHFSREAVNTAIALGDLRQQARTLNNLGIILQSSFDPEVESLFAPLKAAVESTGSWRYSHVSHWCPPFYFALKGDLVAFERTIELQSAVRPLEDPQRRLLQSFRRSTENLGYILAEQYVNVTRDFARRGSVVEVEVSYALQVENAAAHLMMSNPNAAKTALASARSLRSKLHVAQNSGVQGNVLMEVVCLGAIGQWSAARKLCESGMAMAPALAPAKEMLRRFCDGPPFVGLREAQAQCFDQPFIGLAAILVDRAVKKLCVDQVLPNLTAAETDVLKLLSLGKSNKAIADARSRSTETVKRQVAAIYKKLGVENRTSALAAAKELGIV